MTAWRGCWTMVAAAVLSAGGAATGDDAGERSVVAEGAELERIPGEFQFTEGPAADRDGSVFFSDVAAGRMYHLSVDGELTLAREETNRANGLFLDPEGNLLACESGAGRMVAIDREGEVTVIAAEYDGRRFNAPNDCWVDPRGGVYFTDPIYGQATRVQDGEHVYYVTPDRLEVVRVVDDMIKPNGLIGTAEGRILYITDHGDGKTWRYDVETDGTLTQKALFAEHGGDGMTIDQRGNVYLATDAFLVFDPEGELMERIEVPERPTNATFWGPDRGRLLITARSSAFSLEMAVSGLPAYERAAE